MVINTHVYRELYQLKIKKKKKIKVTLYGSGKSHHRAGGRSSGKSVYITMEGRVKN